MRRLVVRFLPRAFAVCALASMLSSPAATAFADSHDGGPTGVYLALGDSLAAGVGATDWSDAIGSQLGYVPRFGHFLRGQAHYGIDRVINVAVPGETSASILTSGQWQQAQVIIADPSTNVRVVSLDIGGNDLLGLLTPFGPCGVDPTTIACRELVTAAVAAFPTNYVTLLTSLRAALDAEDAEPEQIFVMTYYNPFSGTGNATFTPVVDDAVRAINQMIVTFGAQFGVTIVDVYPVFAGKGPSLTHILASSTSFDPHPTNAGYAQIAATFIKSWR